MEALIPIHDHNGQKAVSARELHSFLESKKDFSDWIKHRITKYGLVENQDYVSFTQKVEREIGGSTRIEYALTIDAAKELSMVEGNAKGKQARQYFIECEKIAKDKHSKQLTAAEMCLLNAQAMVDMERKQSQIESRITQLEQRTKTDIEYFTIMGYGTLNGFKVPVQIAAQIGQKASRRCKELGYPIGNTPDPRFGRVNTYPISVLKEVFPETIF